jgi:hypothetical protein
VLVDFGASTQIWHLSPSSGWADWFGSVSLLPLATALAGPAEDAFGRAPALWGCAGLVVAVTAAVLLVPDVRNLTRRTVTVTARPTPTSPDAERSAGGLG